MAFVFTFILIFQSLLQEIHLLVQVYYQVRLLFSQYTFDITSDTHLRILEYLMVYN